MTVRKIITEWLKARGYDGLVGDGCACLTDDFAPCEVDHDCIETLNSLFCRAGKVVILPECKECKHKCISADEHPVCKTAGIIKTSEGLL